MVPYTVLISFTAYDGTPTVVRLGEASYEALVFVRDAVARRIRELDADVVSPRV